MIIEWLLDLIEGALTFVVGLFPEVSFNPVDWFAGALGVLGDANYFFPFAELAALVVAFLALGAGFIVVSIALWILALIRGGSSVG